MAILKKKKKLNSKTFDQQWFNITTAYYSIKGAPECPNIDGHMHMRHPRLAKSIQGTTNSATFSVDGNLHENRRPGLSEHTSELVFVPLVLWTFLSSLRITLSCFLALALVERRSAHCAAVTSEWHAIQRVLMFSSLHSPVWILWGKREWEKKILNFSAYIVKKKKKRKKKKHIHTRFVLPRRKKP